MLIHLYTTLCLNVKIFHDLKFKKNCVQTAEVVFAVECYNQTTHNAASFCLLKKTTLTILIKCNVERDIYHVMQSQGALMWSERHVRPQYHYNQVQTKLQIVQWVFLLEDQNNSTLTQHEFTTIYCSSCLPAPGESNRSKVMCRSCLMCMCQISSGLFFCLCSSFILATHAVVFFPLSTSSQSVLCWTLSSTTKWRFWPMTLKSPKQPSYRDTWS